jgi:hypothetical protein
MLHDIYSYCTAFFSVFIYFLSSKLNITGDSGLYYEAESHGEISEPKVEAVCISETLVNTYKTSVDKTQNARTGFMVKRNFFRAVEVLGSNLG